MRVFESERSLAHFHHTSSVLTKVVGKIESSMDLFSISKSICATEAELQAVLLMFYSGCFPAFCYQYPAFYIG